MNPYTISLVWPVYSGHADILRACGIGITSESTLNAREQVSRLAVLLINAPTRRTSPARVAWINKLHWNSDEPALVNNLRLKVCEDESREAFERLRALYEKMVRPFRVLLVEDDSRDIDLLRHAFNHYRVEFKVALTGEEAVQWIQEDECELCLIDLKLPGMSGVDVIAWAKSKGKAIPFVVLTGLNDASPLIKESLDAGAECVFQKPLSAENVKMIFGGL